MMQAEADNQNNNGNDKNLAEEQKITLLRSYVESCDPSSKEADDLMLRRFLRARDFDVDKAGAMFLKYLKWKKTFLPKGYVLETEIQYDLFHNKVFIGGVDKNGRLLLVIFGGRHRQNPKPGGVDEFKRFVVYSLDKIIARAPPRQEKFTCIVDTKGWGYASADLQGILGAFSILQDCYPERLGKMFMVNVPKMFITMWKMVYPFIDNTTKKRIVFVENKKLKSTLVEDIDENQLPDVYGGKRPLVSIQDA